MKYFRRILDFYINSSIHVALAVYALTWVTLIELNLSYKETLLYFVFYATITGYNFVKFFGIAKFHHRQLASWLKIIQIVSFISFLLMCYYMFDLKLQTMICLCIFFVLTFLYAIPFLAKQKRSLRHITGLKVYVIAFVWSGVTVFLPVINEQVSLSADVFIMALQRFLFVIVLMLPFEIRDLKYDSSDLATIPQKMGVKRTKYFGTILLILIFLLEFFKDNLNDYGLLALALILIVTFLFVVFSKVEQGKYYSSFWVESLPIWWLGLLLILI